ncbi:TonB-dependent receptor [Novosphingobium terrae]|uniref:TonB-dependent receptor n=1 Tax=Novosphingobium terrae TaxID=2726189 RepID=UPI0019815909|nr:TonB-dependent receptor [Novosphingobium terrae]
MAVAAMGACGPANAQEAQRYDINLPAETLGAAMRDLAVLSHTNIVSAAQNTDGKTIPGLAGRFTVGEALDRLLAPNGLKADASDGGYIVSRSADGAQGAPDIVVTGSRIAGVPVPATVISISRAVMEERGYTDLGAVVRDIPQSFAGGQNPGLGTNVPAIKGVDVGGGSSIDLRGLGSDATLTLLDGHRVAYTGSRQSVDVSAIPIGIVDHIDIVPDGASALYGSDAVAGVANVVLRQDMKGLETTARVGSSTDGGYVQQQYGAAAGDRWKDGGFIVAYDYGSSSTVWGRQRSYARDLVPNLSLMPELWHHSIAFNGHQALTDNLTLTTNAYYNIRREETTYPAQVGTVLGTSNLKTRDQVFGVAPTLKLKLGQDWHVNLAGTIGKERVDLISYQCGNGACASANGGSDYRNLARSIELNGDGKLIDLPGGPLKLAIGAGYRNVSFTRWGGTASTTNTQHSQDSTYAFGELAIPVVGPSQDVPFIKSLNVSAAVRYERYPGIGNVATPKLGLIYAPDDDLDIKASWGKSFRAPTLYEQYQPRSAYLYNATTFGAVGAPANATALYMTGGSPALKPERANTWSAGMTLHPRAVPGARLEVSYFNIHYRDRIVTPITIASQALSNPIYQSQITPAPDAAAQAAAIASATFYQNFSSYPYVTSGVVAIIDNATVNAGHQWVQGVDILAEYGFDAGPRDHVNLSLDTVYIQSKQQVSTSQPILPLAGTIFNPPNWRGQANLTWKHGDATVNVSGHYTGSIIDNRAITPVRLSSRATLDLTARYALHRLFSKLETAALTFSVQNIFNTKPPVISISSIAQPPYDSTNYSPIGRMVSVGVTTKW